MRNPVFPAIILAERFARLEFLQLCDVRRGPGWHRGSHRTSRTCPGRPVVRAACSGVAGALDFTHPSRARAQRRPGVARTAQPGDRASLAGRASRAARRTAPGRRWPCWSARARRARARPATCSPSGGCPTWTVRVAHPIIAGLRRGVADLHEVQDGSHAPYVMHPIMACGSPHVRPQAC